MSSSSSKKKRTKPVDASSKKKKSARREAAGDDDAPDVVVDQRPIDAYFDRLEAVMKATPDCVGRMLVRGLDEEEEEGDDDDGSSSDGAGTAARAENLSEEDLANLRWIVITEDRAKALEFMERGLLEEQYGESAPEFDAEFAYRVEAMFAVCFEMVKQTPLNSTKFDLLFAFTSTIYDFADFWLEDHEEIAFKKKLEKLGRVWSEALRCPDLGIDAEFTEPGLFYFLTCVKVKFETLDVEHEDEDWFEKTDFDFLPPKPKY